MLRSAASSFIRSMIASFNSTCSPHNRSTLYSLFLKRPSIPLPYHNLLISKYLSLFSIIKALFFLQLCYKTKNIELLLLFIPCVEWIRQEPSIVKFLTYQKTDVLYSLILLYWNQQKETSVWSPLWFNRKGKAYVSIRGVVEGEPPALGLVTGRTIREDIRGDLTARHQSV